MTRMQIDWEHIINIYVLHRLAIIIITVRSIRSYAKVKHTHAH